MRFAVLAAALTLLAGTFLAGAAAPAAGAAMVGDASVSFSADRTVVVNGRSFHGRLYHAPGHERHEQDLLGHDVFILDAETERGFLIVPSLKTYAEFPFPPVLAALASRDLTRDPVRNEVINGVPTTKYRVRREVDGTDVEGFLWVSPDNILMKFDVRLERAGHSKPLTIAMELSHVKDGPQDRHLFEPPRNFAKVPDEALEQLLGMIH